MCEITVDQTCHVGQHDGNLPVAEGYVGLGDFIFNSGLITAHPGWSPDSEETLRISAFAKGRKARELRAVLNTLIRLKMPS